MSPTLTKLSANESDASRPSRLFAGIELDTPLRTALTGWRVGARQQLGARWVAPENLHLTLRFFGDVSPDVVPKLMDALSRVRSTRAFTLHCVGVGCFPKLNKARVLWAGIDNPPKALAELHEGIEQAAVQCSLIADDKVFHPHVTIARFRTPPKDLAVWLRKQADESLDFGWVQVYSVALFASELSSSGARYTVKRRYELGSGDASMLPKS